MVVPGRAESIAGSLRQKRLWDEKRAEVESLATLSHDDPCPRLAAEPQAHAPDDVLVATLTFPGTGKSH